MELFVNPRGGCPANDEDANGRQGRPFTKAALLNELGRVNT
jgi:hypothetical protein